MDFYHDYTLCWLILLPTQLPAPNPNVALLTFSLSHTHTRTRFSESTLRSYLLNSRSKKIKLARWNPTFVLSDGGMKWDSINTRSPIGLAGWLPVEAALKRLGAAITQVELQKRWGWEGDDSALITGSEQGVNQLQQRERAGEVGMRRGGGIAARTALMTRLVFLKQVVAFSKARQLDGDLFRCSSATAVTRATSTQICFFVNPELLIC